MAEIMLKVTIKQLFNQLQTFYLLLACLLVIIYHSRLSHQYYDLKFYEFANILNFVNLQKFEFV